jgi:hypothetical protein
MTTKVKYNSQQGAAIDALDSSFGGLTTAQKKAIANTKQAFEPTYPSNAAAKLTPVSSLSTEKGIDALNQAQGTENKLAGVPTVQPTGTGGTGAAQVPATTKITLINPDTEQTISFDDAGGSKKSIQQYLNSGYQLSEASGTIPSWLIPASGGSNGTSDGMSELNKAKNEFEDLSDKLKNFSVDGDPVLEGQLSGITNKWDARIKQMERIGETRVAALTQTGIRTGSRYTGGTGGVFGSIISEEERQGVERVAGLEADKQEALANARQAYTEQKWAQYSKLVDVAETKYKAQLDTLKELNRAQEAQDKLLQDANNEVTKSINGVLTDAAKNGAPADIQRAVSAAGSLSEAVAAAGDYLQSGAGIVGEYQFYKRQAGEMGQVPMSFDEYQNVDANRKRSIAAAGVAGANGMTQKQTTNFLAITNKFQADPFINNAIKGQTAITIADQVLANPNSATNQLKSLYVLVKNLDPDSAVREGEVSLAEKTQSYLAKFNTTLTRVSTGQVISPQAATELAQATKDLASAWSSTAARRQKQYNAQASVAGIGDAFDEYIAASDMAYNQNDPVQTEEAAKQSVINYGAAHPEVQEHIRSLAGVIQPDKGRAYTWAEIGQIIGI